MKQNPPHSLPVTFGRCLGIEGIDPKSIKIRSPKNIPERSESEEEIISYAEAHLPQIGTLAINDRGFVYLDISDAYIHELSPYIEASGVTSPPYFDTIYSAGAHVTVIPISESHVTFPIELLGEELPFTITGCFSVEPENWIDVETVWFLTIDAPRLSQIRMDLGLSPKIDGEEFHITIAVKKRFVSIHDIFGSENQTIFIKKT